MSTNTDDILIPTSESSSTTGDPVESLQPTRPARAETDQGTPTENRSAHSANEVKSAGETRPVKRELKPRQFKMVSLAEALLANPPIPESLVEIICSELPLTKKCAAVKQLLDASVQGPSRPHPRYQDWFHRGIGSSRWRHCWWLFVSTLGTISQKDLAEFGTK